MAKNSKTVSEICDDFEGVVSGETWLGPAFDMRDNEALMLDYSVISDELEGVVAGNLQVWGSLDGLNFRLVHGGVEFTEGAAGILEIASFMPLWARFKWVDGGSEAPLISLKVVTQ